jgi:hypothetical protein
MALVKFLRDFGGRATAEQHYPAGTVVDLPAWQVSMCLAEGAAEKVVSAGDVPPLDDAGAGATSTPAPVKPKRAPRKPKAAKP